jgi:hypothetical protein
VQSRSVSRFGPTGNGAQAQKGGAHAFFDSSATSNDEGDSPAVFSVFCCFAFARFSVLPRLPAEISLMNAQPQLQESDAVAFVDHRGNRTTWPAIVESSGSERALMKRLMDSEVFVRGWRTSNTIFAIVGRTVVKFGIEKVMPDRSFKMRDFLRPSPHPRTIVSIGAAKEADLLNAQRCAESGEATVAVRELLNLVRAADAPPAPAEPLKIEITNASEIGKIDRVLTIKRDDSGVMTGAAVESVT